MNDQQEAGHAQDAPARVDLHCHSSASDIAHAGIKRAAGMPHCATPPRELYKLAKRRGMDFVTITDHNTIAGALVLADEPDVFISEELTTWFKGEQQAVHVLCFGITPDDHERLQERSADVVACAEYLHEHEIACALAHPFVDVAAPLSPNQRRMLAELFEAWETRNGLCARELNAPAAIYIETHGGIAVGGSDDHAGVDVGCTYSQTPFAAGPAELLEHIRSGQVAAHGTHGSAAKWAHGALALAARTLATAGRPAFAAPEPRAKLELAERIVLASERRNGAARAGLGPEQSRRLLRAWLGQLDLDIDAGGLLGMVQSPGFRHGDLERRARRSHERRATAAIGELLADTWTGSLEDASTALFSASVPAVPYVQAAALLARQRAALSIPEEEPVRIAGIADGVGSLPGLEQTLLALRERGIAGHELDVIGTDASVDRRLPAMSEIALPFCPGSRLGVPSLFAVAEVLTDRRYDLVHVCAPGPTGIAALLIARAMGIPVVGGYHTELRRDRRGRRADQHVEQALSSLLEAFYRHCTLVLSPSRCADASILQLRVAAERIVRWEPGVDLERFNPARYAPGILPDAFNILYRGRLSREEGTDLLAEAFLAARDRDPRLHLVIAGRGEDEDRLRARLGPAATFLGWPDGDRLAAVYATADLLVFASATDTFGQTVLEAQASGLPVLAVDSGGPAELIENGRSGCLVAAEPEMLAGAIRGLGRRGALRDRLATGGLLAVRERSWDRSLEQLGESYARALGDEPIGMAELGLEVARAA